MAAKDCKRKRMYMKNLVVVALLAYSAWAQQPMEETRVSCSWNDYFNVSGAHFQRAMKAAAPTKNSPTKFQVEQGIATSKCPCGVKDFLPAGWVVERSIWGDLNADGQDDLACVMNAGDPDKLHETEPFVGVVRVEPQSGKLSCILDENPRILLILLSDGPGFRLGDYNVQILQPHKFPTGETLDRLEIDDGKVRLGLVHMDRKHGNVFARISYEFALNSQPGGRSLHSRDLLVGQFRGDQRFHLVSATETTVDRYITDREETRIYDFQSRQVVVRTSCFSSRQFLSKDSYPLEVPAPTLQDVGPNWQIEGDF